MAKRNILHPRSAMHFFTQRFSRQHPGLIKGRGQVIKEAKRVWDGMNECTKLEFRNLAYNDKLRYEYECQYIGKDRSKGRNNHNSNLFNYKDYMYEELIEGQKLSEIINDHENVKYLPGHALPENVTANPDLFKVCVGSDILLFVLPQEFVSSICSQLRYRVKKTAIAVTMIKGLNVEEGRLSLISNTIRKDLNIPCSALMGANIALGVASEEFCEATLGYVDLQQAEILKKLFETKMFKVRCVPDEECVELCGALKNVIAFAAGLVDGLQLGGAYTKAAILRLGFMEMIDFCRRYFPNTRLETFFESCAMADLVASSYAGRNRLVAEQFGIEKEKMVDELEMELLERESGFEKFPTLRTVHLVAARKIPVQEFALCFQNHPQHGVL